MSKYSIAIRAPSLPPGLVLASSFASRSMTIALEVSPIQRAPMVRAPAITPEHAADDLWVAYPKMCNANVNQFNFRIARDASAAGNGKQRKARSADREPHDYCGRPVL